MQRRHDIQLPTSLKDRLAQGHPWVYRNHLPPDLGMPAGTWVRVRCGDWSGYGLWDEEGPIALRIFSERQIPDAAWLRERVRLAWALRAPLRAAGVSAYRWLFGEGDGLPGLTVDLYGDWAVVQTYAASVEILLDWLAAALREIAPLRGIVIRQREPDLDLAEPRTENREPEQRTKSKEQKQPDGQMTMSRSTTDHEPRIVQNPKSKIQNLKLLWGEPPPRHLVVEEHGLRFYTDLRAGQKTGLFLDQRENRRYVEGLSDGRAVLNCFAYTGAFSLYALRGGARSVVSADIGKGLAEATDANIALNRLDAARHSFATGDCFELLARYVEEGRRFDLVILDPPSFAKSKRNRYAALRAYTRLNALGMRCVGPGGLLATASCTSQVGPEAFKEMLAAAGASAGRRLQIFHEAGQPLDHPAPAHFPEGHYLKFVVGRVGERG
ncbi:MAG: class I SAM-dependent rRNA methyltransferase [Roseiflexaceae bacterium]